MFLGISNTNKYVYKNGDFFSLVCEEGAEKGEAEKFKCLLSNLSSRERIVLISDWVYFDNNDWVHNSRQYSSDFIAVL